MLGGLTYQIEVIKYYYLISIKRLMSSEYLELLLEYQLNNVVMKMIDHLYSPIPFNHIVVYKEHLYKLKSECVFLRTLHLTS